MVTTLNEPIKTLVLFQNGKTLPLTFTWNNKTIKLTSLNFTFHETIGNTKIVHFSVSTQTEAYELTFNTKDLTWRVVNVYSKLGN